MDSQKKRKTTDGFETPSNKRKHASERRVSFAVPENEPAEAEESASDGTAPIYAEDLELEPSRSLFIVRIPPGVDVKYLVGKRIPVTTTGRKRLSITTERCVLGQTDFQPFRSGHAWSAGNSFVTAGESGGDVFLDAMAFVDDGELEEQDIKKDAALDNLKRWAVCLPSKQDGRYRLVSRPVTGTISLSRSLDIPAISYETALSGKVDASAV